MSSKKVNNSDKDSKYFVDEVEPSTELELWRFFQYHNNPQKQYGRDTSAGNPTESLASLANLGLYSN